MSNRASRPDLLALIDGTHRFSIDHSKMGKVLFDSLFDLGDFKFGSFTKKLVGTVSSNTTIHDKAFETIFQALVTACRNLIIENHKDKIQQIKGYTNEAQSFWLDISKNLKTATIDKDFFKNPARWEFLEDFQPVFAVWLEKTLVLPTPTANQRTNELPAAFWNTLIHAWDSDFQEVASHFKNPFIQEYEVFEAQKKYYEALDEYYDRETLDRECRLSDIYLTPSFKTHRRNFPEKHQYRCDNDGFASIAFKGKHLHDYVLKYFLRDEMAFGFRAEKSRMLLLLGQPGQGKTSFCYRLLRDYLAEYSLRQDLIFMQLRYLPNAREFVQHPLETLKSLFANKGLDIEKGLLVLDGLDELYMTEGLTDTEINDFFYGMTRRLKNHPEMRVIITSRFNYIRLEKVSKNDVLVLKLDILTLEQQKQWLEKYKTFFPNCRLEESDLQAIFDEKEKDFKALWELINQPILLHLIARSNFDVKKGENKARIYDKLFKTLIHRRWEDSQLKKFENLDEEEFREYLSALALHIYQSDHEFILLDELLKMPITKRFVKNNLGDYKDLEDALKDVLISFYFKPIDNQITIARTQNKKAEAIEFYHKSLQEFLAAERIWEDILYKFTEQTGKKRKRYKLDEWKDALEIIWQLGSPKALSKDMVPHLIELITNYDDQEHKTQLADQMEVFLPDLIHQQFIYRYEAGEETGFPMKKGLQCFYLYWTVLSHLEEERNYIQEDFKDEFVHLLHFHQRNFFGKVNLSFQKLEEAYLRGANLRGTNFFGANLFGANFFGANLFEVDLSGANLLGANLCRADLYTANLSRVILSRADFSGADLYGADLRGADLREADLREADLRRADLREADLREADLRRADLAKVRNLTYQQLQSVRTLFETKNIPEEWLAQLKEEKAELFKDPDKILLEDIDLGDIDLEDLDLGDLDLGDIDLEDLEDLEDLDLGDIDLSDIDLEGLDLED